MVGRISAQARNPTTLLALNVVVSAYALCAKPTYASYASYAWPRLYFPLRLSIDSIWSMMPFMRATSAWYGFGEARSTPAAFTSSYG